MKYLEIKCAVLRAAQLLRDFDALVDGALSDAGGSVRGTVFEALFRKEYAKVNANVSLLKPNRRELDIRFLSGGGFEVKTTGTLTIVTNASSLRCDKLIPQDYLCVYFTGFFVTGILFGNLTATDWVLPRNGKSQIAELRAVSRERLLKLL